MSEFLYLFRGGDARDVQQSPEKMQEHMQKWMEWMGQLGQSGKLVGGKPLDPGGKVVANKGNVITDGPFAESKEIVGGYLIVNAENLEEATELSKGCPIFEHNGLVEVREIQDIGM